ncbi:MAG: RES family NAD+ phosphorylase [Bacteroidota bacterium]
MIVYRLSREKYCNDLSGKGAELAGGRWNSKGVAMLYISESRALCLAEIAVHLPLGMIPKDYYLVELEISENAIIGTVDENRLPADWHSFPHSPATQDVGDNFISENKFLVLKVPSAVVRGDYNYLINPNHLQSREIKIIKTEPFQFDERLFK